MALPGVTGEDSPVPASPVSVYRIVRQTSGEWYLYRNDQLIDSDDDREQSPLEEIFRWATQVVWFDDRVRVLDWVEAADTSVPTTYVARIDPT
jgi:hypothetical protein